MSDADRQKPKPGPDDVVCSGCWTVRPKHSAIGWTFYTFRYLDAALLCPDCKGKHGPDFDKLMKGGL